MAENSVRGGVGNEDCGWPQQGLWGVSREGFVTVAPLCDEKTQEATVGVRQGPEDFVPPAGLLRVKREPLRTFVRGDRDLSTSEDLRAWGP
jgi:hypothetical protein